MYVVRSESPGRRRRGGTLGIQTQAMGRFARYFECFGMHVPLIRDARRAYAISALSQATRELSL